jgi:hypothetical protein
MTYQDSANLTADQEYQRRLQACVTNEALLKPDDAFADKLLTTPMLAITAFAPTVAVAPGFGDKYVAGGQAAITDGDLLSAVQSLWPRMSELHLPEPPTP